MACDKNLGIGKNNRLPWRLPGDMKYFRQITSTQVDNLKNAVIVGRKTWESIPEKMRPLPGRLNVVLTRDKNYKVPQGAVVSHSLDQALEKLEEEEIGKIFVIGGAEIYQESLRHPLVDLIYLTEISSVFDCDAFFPDYRDNFELLCESDVQKEDGIEYRFKVFKKKHQAD